MKPLSEKELHHMIHMKMLSKAEDSQEIEGSWTVVRLGHAVTIAQELIEADRKAYGEYVIGEDEDPRKKTNLLAQDEVPIIRNQLRAEQRQRNQGENTDDQTYTELRGDT